MPGAGPTTFQTPAANDPRGSFASIPPQVQSNTAGLPLYESIDLTMAKPAPAKESSMDPKLQAVQQQIDDTVIMMRHNMQLALERDDQLTNLEDRAEELQASSARFKRTTRAVKQAEWKNSIKWTIAVVVAVLLLILVVILLMQPWKW